MDIQLPGGLNGVDATRRIRTFNESTPIVSMTASAAPRQIAVYLANGMNDVLPKPFSKDSLLALVARFCQLNLSNRVVINGGSAIASGSGSSSVSRAESFSIEEVFNLDPDSLSSSS